MFLFIKQMTAYKMRISDWRSDVCSSDLEPKLSIVDIRKDEHHEIVYVCACFGCRHPDLQHRHCGRTGLAGGRRAWCEDGCDAQRRWRCPHRLAEARRARAGRWRSIARRVRGDGSALGGEGGGQGGEY